MPRIAIVGVSGSGKSTLARALGLPRLELDGVFHQAGWTTLAPDEFQARVAGFCGGERWVVDGSYLALRDVVWSRAELIVWLDPPRWLVMVRVLRRTLGRVIRRTELWNGNRESWRNLVSRDPEKSIVLWAWTSYGPRRDELETQTAAAAGVVRLRTRAEVRRFVRAMAT